MTVKDLRAALEDYPDDAHVVVAYVPRRSVYIKRAGVKLDVKDVWGSTESGVVNVIAVGDASEVERELLVENELLPSPPPERS